MFIFKENIKNKTIKISGIAIFLGAVVENKEYIITASKKNISFETILWIFCMQFKK